MMYITQTINPPYISMLVGDFHDDALTCKVLSGEIFRVPRELVQTPVMCCKKCGKPALQKFDKRKRKAYAECPDNARHLYDHFYTASHDTKRFNHDQRRKLHKEAKKWLGIWRRVFEKRCTDDTESVNIKVSTAV